MAYLTLIAINQVLPEVGKPFDQLQPSTQHWIDAVTMLSGGFIVTSLIWGAALAYLIDGRVAATAAALALAGAFSWFGVIHSPLPSGAIMPPGRVIAELEAQGRAAAAAGQTPYHWAAAYGVMATAVLVLGRSASPPAREDQRRQVRLTEGEGPREATRKQFDPGAIRTGRRTGKSLRYRLTGRPRAGLRAALRTRPLDPADRRRPARWTAQRSAS